MDSLNSVFTKDYMRKLDLIKNFHSKSSASYGGGARKSLAKGSSYDFLDYRDYTYGDDLRYVDFNIYARFDKLYLKLFEEERQGVIHIFLDTSKSMETPEIKAFESKVITASLAYLGLAKSDKVEVFACGENVKAMPFMSSKSRFPEVIKFLDELGYDKNTDIKKSVINVAKTLNDKGSSIFLSDFLYSDGYKDILNALLSKKQSVSAVQILSASELTIASNGLITYIDSETNEQTSVELNERISSAYKKMLENYINEIKIYAANNQINFLSFVAEEKNFAPFSQFVSGMKSLP